MERREQATPTRWLVAGTAAVLLAGLVASTAGAAVAMSGRFTTPTARGAISYTPQRGFRGGSIGVFVVANRSRPGSLYAARGGGIGMAWYFGTTGITAGNALVTVQPNGTYAGPIWFFDRQGNTTDGGTVVVTFP